MLHHTLDLLTGGWRYTLGLRGFLRETITAEDAKAIVNNQLRNREESFLHVLEHGVYAHPSSPYLRLLRHAGFEFDEVKALVQEYGLEGALTRLHDAGVYVTLDEFKGRAPVSRPGLQFEVIARDFDNPLSRSHFAASTGGSRGGGTRIEVDFGLIAQDSANMICGLEAIGVEERPIFVWRAMPPSAYGLKLIFRLAHLGRAPARWFAPNRPGWNRQGIEGRVFMAFTLLASRLFGRGLPRPVYAQEPDEIVRTLAKASRSGVPAAMYCIQSQAVRICHAAEHVGADIRDTVFLSSGEPYTEGKAAALERAGTRGTPQYSMSEAGIICLPCGLASEPDDMHLLTHKLALLVRPRRLAPDLEVNGLTYTSLQATASKLMLNVESGDYGVADERDCGCLWARMGLTTHVHHVRSYEKLTSEGVMFMGSMLYEVLEQTLPARFGGAPTDYQLVEEEEDGVTKVSMIVSPRVGPIDDSALLDTFYKKVSFAEWSRRQADSWRESGTLRVQRREPYATKVGKILPLHVLNTSQKASRSQALAHND